MTFFINIGKWGGFYCNSGRICIGFVAFTFLPFDVDTCVGGRSDWEKMKKKLDGEEAIEGDRVNQN